MCQSCMEHWIGKEFLKTCTPNSYKCEVCGRLRTNVYIVSRVDYDTLIPLQCANYIGFHMWCLPWQIQDILEKYS